MFIVIPTIRVVRPIKLQQFFLQCEAEKWFNMRWFFSKISNRIAVFWATSHAKSGATKGKKHFFLPNLWLVAQFYFFLIFCTAPHKKSRKQFSKPWRQTAYFFTQGHIRCRLCEKSDTGEASSSLKMQLYRIQTVLPMTMILYQVQNLNHTFQVQLKLF